MKKILFALPVLGAALLSAPAWAAPVEMFDDNASEWSSATVPVPGMILPIGGSGQVNGNFATVADTTLPGAQIAMRANRRFSPVPLANAGATYFIEPGESGPGQPLWNYDLHIDLRGTGLSFDDYTISFLSSVANHSTPDLQAAIEFGGALPPGSLDGVELYQSSLNPGFFASGIDPFASGVETFALTLTPKSGVNAPILGVDIAVNVVPEPTTVTLGLLGLVGVAAPRRR